MRRQDDGPPPSIDNEKRSRSPNESSIQGNLSTEISSPSTFWYKFVLFSRPDEETRAQMRDRGRTPCRPVEGWTKQPCDFQNQRRPPVLLHEGMRQGIRHRNCRRHRWYQQGLPVAREQTSGGRPLQPGNRACRT